MTGGPIFLRAKDLAGESVDRIDMALFRFSLPALAAALLFVTLPLRAERITLRDGTLLEGTIENRNSNGFDLHMHFGIISTVRHINILDIADIEISPETAVPTPAQAQTPTPAPSPGVSVAPLSPPPPAAVAAPPAASPETAPATQEDARPAFFRELVASALGHGPDDLTQLPEKLQDEWNDVLRSEALGNRPETLEKMRAMEDGFATLPHGLARLDAITRKAKKMSFGAWEASIHWDAMYSRMNAGQVDVGEVRDEEKEPLVGLLKEKSIPALLPMQPFFPPVDRKTGRPEPYNPRQLSGITYANASDLKPKAAWAATILLAQLKAEPEMPEMDRAVILTQLTTVRRVLNRATELEPLAKAAAAKAVREQRMAEQRRQGR